MSPPNPPPRLEETKTLLVSRDPIATLGKAWALHRVEFQIGVFWTFALCESVALLAAYFPRSISQALPSILLNTAQDPAHGMRITYLWLASYALMHAGAMLRLACHRVLGRYFTWQLALQKDQPLITSGPYSVVRHPGYTAVWMITAGLLLCQFSPGSWYAECVGWDSIASKAFTATWASFCTLIPASLMLRINAEDDILRVEFGDEWKQYARNTPWKILPYIY